MARTNPKTRYSENKRHSDLPRFESVVRISNLPIVENSIHIAGNVYDRLKVSKTVLII